jgi:hypothetical protein
MACQGTAFKRDSRYPGTPFLGQHDRLRQAGSRVVIKSRDALAGRCTVNGQDLFVRVECYVSLRRALGYVVTSKEKLLKDFVRFVE